MSSSPAAASADSALLLHCSPARTVWLRRANGSLDVVAKVYVSGSQADAERELAMGQHARGTGVVDYLAASTDPETNRPCVTTAYVSGDNLESLVANNGAMPAEQACRQLAAVARTLARLHALATPEAPRGICHGDIKPQNLLATAAGTLLLDFEHACAIGSASDRAFTGGTTAFAPPEAANGAAPNAGFDVYGLGATLAFLLNGGGERQIPQHPEVVALLADCRAVDPSRRPTAATAAERLQQLADALAADEAEVVLHDWTSGTMALASTATSLPPDPRILPWRRRRRLLERLPTLLQRPASMPSDPTDLWHELRRVTHVLARFPRHRDALARRRELLQACAAVLRGAAEQLHTSSKSEQFDRAEQQLRAIEQLTQFAAELPRGLATVSGLQTSGPPNLLQRSPIAYLQRLAKQLAAEQQELAARISRIEAAERNLDFALAEQEIDAMAAEYGGSSQSAAKRRDQLHRLGFYLDRVARAKPNVDQVAPMWNAKALQPVLDFAASAASANEARARRDAPGGTVGLRSLQLTLASLADEFPHLPQVPPALDALSRALHDLTDDAWKQLAEAEQSLRAVPVPVRPLQVSIGRLDTFRTLEVFVDRPNRPRSSLLDGIERLRLGLEQARSARDRLAEHAEHALARRHWTTGLFDMERAVAGLTPGDDQERVEAERLRERLDEARRTKQEVEAAVRRNVELQAEYAELEDDTSSTFAARLQALEQRRDTLRFSACMCPTNASRCIDRICAASKRRSRSNKPAKPNAALDGTTDPVQRQRLVRETLDHLTTATAAAEHGLEAPRRVVRLIDHWRTLATQTQAAVDAQLRDEQTRRRHRRRMIAIAVVALAATGTAVALPTELAEQTVLIAAHRRARHSGQIERRQQIRRHARFPAGLQLARHCQPAD